MGGCLSAHSKKQKQQRASNHQVSSVKSTPKACKEAINNPSWAPKSGIGRFIQTEQGTVIRTRQINDEDCQHNQDDHCQHKHDPQDSSRASKDEVWFDSHLWLESDSDDDFRSVYGDSLPGISNSLSHPGSTQGTPRPTFVSLKERMQNLVLDVTMPSGQHSDMMSPAEKKRLGEFLLQTLPAGGGLKSGSEGQHASNASMDKGDEQQENSSQKSCLPRLLPSVSFNDKKAPVSPGVHKAKNTLLRLPFKRRSNDFLDNPVPFVSSIIVERPIAGSQVPFCGSDKASEGSWSIVGPSTFKLRGSSYLRDKIKILASEHAMYEPFGVDVYVSPKKIGHIARYVELPGCSKVGNLPSFLILNIQIPMYPATIFLNEIDGEGLNLVLYHKLSERHSKVPSYFQEMFMKVLNDDVERVRGFTADSVIPFREKLKILGRVVNPEELHLSVAERKVVYTYNEKPVLSRPQHSFYQGENYFEVDLDMHRFSYLARKGVEAFRERLKLCILDLGLTVQGNKPDELPEHVLCCVRINKIDFTTCKQLAVNVSSLAKPGKYDERDASEADADSEPIMNGSSV